MKFTVLTTVLALFSVASCTPVPDATLETHAIPSFYPSLAVNIFTPDKGTVKGDVYVFRTTQQGIQHETISLLSIPFPLGNIGKTCSFAFAGGWAPSHTAWFPPGAVSNSQLVQLFRVAGNITASDTYTSRPTRNGLVGTFTICNSGATATWDSPTPTFPCPPSETILGFEVVPMGGFDDVAWPLKAGLAVVVL